MNYYIIFRKIRRGVSKNAPFWNRRRKARFLPPITPFKTEAVVEGFWLSFFPRPHAVLGWSAVPSVMLRRPSRGFL